MEFSTFDPAEFADEIANGATNRDVGTKVLIDNDRVRVWELAVDPGDRLPFHAHHTTYFFVCVEGGRMINRFPDGTMVTLDMADGESWYSEHEGTPEIHDLENVGDTRVRFVTVELRT